MKKWLTKSLIICSLLLVFLSNHTTTLNKQVLGENEIAFADARNRQPVVGIAAFGILHPKFPINQLIKILKNVKRDTIGLSFPYGTFGSSPKNYNRVVSELKKSNKKVHTVLYGICGPCRIPRRDGRLEIFYPKTNIKTLNREIVASDKVKADYVRLITKIKTDFIDPYPDQTFDFVPELEDNLTPQSFGVLYNLSNEVFANNPNVRIIHNPLNHLRRSDLPIEIHSAAEVSPLSLRQGDVINFDGDPFLFKGEKAREREVSFDSIRRLIRSSNSRRVDIYIWRGEWQGLPNTRRKVILTRDNRNYRIIFDSQITELLTIRSRRVAATTLPITLPNPSSFGCKIVNQDYKFLFKEESDDSGPPREGKAAAIFPDKKPSDSLLDLLNARGTLIGQMRKFNGDESKYGRRFYIGTGSNIKPGELAKKALQTSLLSEDIYIKVGKGLCVGPIPSTVRVDNRSINK